MAGSAQAAVNFNFTPGATVQTIGYTILQSFNAAPYIGLTSTPTNGAYQICTGNASICSVPYTGDTTPYVAVLPNSTVTYTLATAATSIAFDWGTASADNMLTVLTTAGNFSYHVPNSNNPDSSVTKIYPLEGTSNYAVNGLLTATATTGQITGLQFTTGTYSFEVDDIAAAVPEPASWAMMVGGFGLIGSAMRRRRSVGLRFA